VWVTDGSFKDKYGTAGFILLPTIDLQEGLLLVNQTSGREDDIDAYQAEAAGIYGCVAFTNKLMKHHQLDQGGVTMACDCLWALRNIFEHKFDKPSQPHYDLVHSCRLLITLSPVTWHSHHVCGHQDDHGRYQDLDRCEQLNVDMDTLAKLHWQTVAHTNRPHFDLPPTTEWSVWHRNRRLTSWSDKVALQLIHEKPTQKYWSKTQRIPQTTQQPAWDALCQSYKSTPLQRKLWIPK
jgi:hypothetical protein